MTNGQRRRDMRSYQKWGIDRIYENESTILAWDMGSGKSVTVLTALDDMLEDGIVRQALIVAPMLVAQATYPDEFEDWKHLRHMDWTLLRVEDDDPELAVIYKRAYGMTRASGATSAEAANFAGARRTLAKEQKRIRLAKNGAEVHIINKEGLPWLWNLFKDKWPYDCLIVDEASCFKNGTRRTKTKEVSIFGAAAKARKFAKRTVLMTGTPTPKGLRNMWGLSYIADLGERLGTARTKFEQRWFDKDYMGWNMEPKEHAFREITERMSDIMFSLDPELYPDLPKVFPKTTHIHLPRKAYEEYQRFRGTLVSEVYDVEAVSKGTLAGKLLQFCIAEGTEVLTDSGWKLIEDISDSDLIWDGEEYVSHSGLIYQGKKETIHCFGVEMTKDHRILTVEGWKTAEEVCDGKSGERFDRHEVRIPHGIAPMRDDRGNCEKGEMALPLRLWSGSRAYKPESSFAKSSLGHPKLWLQTWRDCIPRCRWSHDDRDTSASNLDIDAPEMSRRFAQGLQELWGAWNRHASRMVRLFSGVLGRCERRLCKTPINRQGGQQQVLFQGQLSLGHAKAAVEKHKGKRICSVPVGNFVLGRSSRVGWSGISDVLSSFREGGAGGGTVSPGETAVNVYDISQCGPRNRYVVRGTRGPLIVHNCNGSMYNEDGDDVWIHDKKLDALEEIIEEADGEPVLIAYNFQFDLARIKKRFKKAVVFGEGDVRKTKADWNAGKIPIMLAHPQSVGHGQNLQFGGNILIWYGLVWDLEVYQQMNKRLHRPGQTRPVTIHHIIAKNTYDEEILPRLMDRASTQDAILKSFRLSMKKR